MCHTLRTLQAACGQGRNQVGPCCTTASEVLACCCHPALTICLQEDNASPGSRCIPAGHNRNWQWMRCCTSPIAAPGACHPYVRWECRVPCHVLKCDACFLADTTCLGGEEEDDDTAAGSLKDGLQVSHVQTCNHRSTCHIQVGNPLLPLLLSLPCQRKMLSSVNVQGMCLDSPGMPVQLQESMTRERQAP
jgi:hypothetical protein